MPKETRNTRQKRIIQEKIKEFKSFFTAEELYEKTKKTEKKLGIATVYRFLNEFVSVEKIHSYYCKGKKIYSPTRNNHCHFICDVCRKITHFNVESIDFVKNKLSEGEICHFQIDVYGTCKNCLKK